MSATPRPTTDIPDDWAGDATWTSGTRIGDDTKTTPTAGERTQGHVGSLNFFGDLANWLGNLIGGWLRYTDDRNFGGVFGDGSDGDVTIAADTTLIRDMFYANLTVDATKTLDAAGFRIFASETLTISGTGAISNDGNNAVGAAAGAASGSGSIGEGAPGGGGAVGVGAPGTGLADALGGDGGGGGTGTGGIGGPGGVATDPAAADGSVRYGPAMVHGHLIGAGNLTFLVGGGGGGGGGGDGGANAGGGGGGAGGVVVISARSITMANPSNIQSTGGNGAAGTGANAAGGGGGGGGVVIVVYRNKSATGTIHATGGAAGASGGGAGTGGINGVDGTVIEIVV